MDRASSQYWWVLPAVVVGIAGAALRWLPATLEAKPVYLWTDLLLFLLAGIAIFFAAYIRHREHLRVPWGRVFRRRIGMAAGVILAVYGVTGLLDSIHFRSALPQTGEGTATHYSAEVRSVLDTLLAPLRTRVERTYSAPLATHAYSKETVTLDDGRTERVYPPLQYGGQHLKDPGDRWGDVAARGGAGAAVGFGVWALLVALVNAVVAWRRQAGYGVTLQDLLFGRMYLPWHVAAYTVLVMLVVGFGAGFLSQHYHVLGTDKVGQDVLYQAIKSIRTGLAVGTLSTLIMLPFAIVLGIAAGYFKGWVDDVIQYLYTTLNSIPNVLLIAAAILSVQIYIANHPEWFETATNRADLKLLALCVALGITSWTGLCRLLRGESLKLSEVDFIEAAHAFGARHHTVLLRHILPNVMHIVLIIVVLDFSGLVLAEAVLSYIGVGVDPSTISWGNMINAARLEMAREPMVWWSLAAAFIFMFTLVLSANLFSDTVRDAFDPRLRAQGT